MAPITRASARDNNRILAAKTNPYKYFVDIRFRPSQGSCKHSQDEAWTVTAKFRCCDLEQAMRLAIHEERIWTSANKVPDTEFGNNYWPAYRSSNLRRQGFWLREFPDKPEAQSRWVAHVDVTGRSQQTLTDFRLDDLTEDNILSAQVHTMRDFMRHEKVFDYFDETLLKREDKVHCNDCDFSDDHN